METIAEMNEQSWSSKKAHYCLVRAIINISNWQLSGIDAKQESQLCHHHQTGSILKH